MGYKKICNKYITAMTMELLDAGAPLPEVLETATFMYVAAKKYLKGEQKCTK